MLGKIELTEYNEAAILVKKARLLLSDLKVDEAIAVLEPLYVKTQDAEAAFLLSTVYMAKKDYDKAKSYAQELIDKNEFDDFYYSAVYTRAAALVRSGDPESVSALREANKIFRAACARNPGYVQYYLYRAVCHKELREFNEAIEMLDYIITVAPKLDGSWEGAAKTQYFVNFDEMGKMLDSIPEGTDGIANLLNTIAKTIEDVDDSMASNVG